MWLLLEFDYPTHKGKILIAITHSKYQLLSSSREILRSTGSRFPVVSRQSSPHFAGAPKPRARDISPLYSPRLHLNLTHPHPSSPAFLCALRHLTSTHLSCLGVVISGRGVVESGNSWREGFSGAIIGPWYHNGPLVSNS